MTGVSIARPEPDATKWTYATLGLCVLSVLAMVGAHLPRPDLDPSWTPISEHALGHNGVVMKGAFLALSATCATLLLAWWQTMAG